jgi:hypothetical protein
MRDYKGAHTRDEATEKIYHIKHSMFTSLHIQCKHEKIIE